LLLLLLNILLYPGDAEKKVLFTTFIDMETANSPNGESDNSENDGLQKKMIFSKHPPGFNKKKIKIDGKLDEPIYSRLVPVGNFIQFHPKNGTKPTYKTEVYSFYDKKNIYFAFHCFDDEPEKINADITPFGEYENNDEIVIYLDSFSDKRTYDTFSVNPKGIKSGKRTVWHADAEITPSGWSAEFKIPFKSLRFPVSNIQVWGVNFERKIFRLNESMYWSKVERDQLANLGDTFAKLAGIRDIEGGKNLEVFPYAGYRDSYAGDEKNNKFAYGVDLKYGITSNLTLDMTTSPDYSEVESDPFFYKVSPYEVNLNENRPFYSEGSGFFTTPLDLFYSRRISHPTLAAKITGKEKGYSVGILAARNSHDGSDSFHGVFRLKKDIFRLSNIGMIYTSLEDGNDWNRNMGVDFNFKFKDIYRLSGMAAFSYNKDQPRFDNGMYFLTMVRSVDEGLSLAGLYTRNEPRVNVPAGYIPNVDFNRFLGIVKYSFRREGKWIEKIFLTFWKINENTISCGSMVQDFFQLIVGIVTKSRLELTTTYGIGKIRAKILAGDNSLAVDDERYPSTFFTGDLSYGGSRVVQFGASCTLINDYVYNEDFTGTLAGTYREGYSWVNFKISPRLQLRFNYNKVYFRSLDDTIRFNGDLLDVALNVQVNKKISSFLKFQYDTDAGRFQYDFLIGYEPANVSKIYISIKNYSEERFRFFHPEARSITFKISYLFRI
jgi:hypothetical protein